jgi:thiol-disulfide isomerase/thioredoxin
MLNLKDFFATNTKIIMGIIGAIIIVIICILIYRIYNTSKNNMSGGNYSHQNNFTDYKSSGDTSSKIVLFYAPWCGHCKKLMEGDNAVWQQLKSKYSKTNQNFDEINSDEMPEVANKFGVKEFPTILKIKSTGVEKYTGDRSLESLDKFIKL